MEDELPDEIPDEERGCGHLEDGAAYIRTDPQMFSPNGVLPIFVRCDPPIPYKESHFRGYREFPGLSFEAVTSGTVTEYVPLGSPGGFEDAYEQTLMDNMKKAYKMADDDEKRVMLRDEVHRHFLRLSTDSAGGDHAGEMAAFRSPDLFMHVGKSHYETPKEFIRECREQGLNKRIPMGSRSKPPVVSTGRTRCWLVHPNAIPKRETEDNDEYIPGIIGYAYLTRVIYTEDDDGNVPQYVQEYADSGYMDIVEIGEKIPYDDEHHRLHEYVSDDDEEDGDSELDSEPADSGAEPQESSESVQPSDKPGRDVEAVPDDEDDADDDGSDDDELPDFEEVVDSEPDYLDAESTRERLNEDDEFTFNMLRGVVSVKTDSELQNPTFEELVDALIDAGFRFEPDSDADLSLVDVSE